MKHLTAGLVFVLGLSFATLALARDADLGAWAGIEEIQNLVSAEAERRGIPDPETLVISAGDEILILAVSSKKLGNAGQLELREDSLVGGVFTWSRHRGTVFWPLGLENTPGGYELQLRDQTGRVRSKQPVSQEALVNIPRQDQVHWRDAKPCKFWCKLGRKVAEVMVDIALDLLKKKVQELTSSAAGGQGSETWTRWLNRDRPSGTGDFETLRDHRADNPSEVCAQPVDVECRIRGSLELVGTGKTPSGNVVQCGAEVGLICDNRRQPQGVHCQDYEVRFACP